MFTHKRSYVLLRTGAPAVAALVCGRYHVPPERAVFLEHDDFRLPPAGRNGRGDVEAFAWVFALSSGVSLEAAAADWEVMHHATARYDDARLGDLLA